MPKARILIVDDHPGLCNVLMNILSSGDRYQVDAVQTFEEAMRFIEAGDLALVLCDYNLGEEKNGLDILFNAKEKDPNVITILMTGFGTDQIATRAVAEGVYDYLIKPFKSILDVTNAVERGMKYHLLLKKYHAKVADESLQRELLRETLEKERRTRAILQMLARRLGVREVDGEYLDV